MIERLRSFPGPLPTPDPLRTWLVVGQIEALESISATDRQQTLDSLYQELATGFPLGEMDSFVILKLAGWHESQGNLDSAIGAYQLIADHRPASVDRDHARTALAAALVRRRNPGDMDEAIHYLDTVLAETSDDILEERAILEVARIQMLLKDWETAQSEWAGYLEHPGWLLARAEANYQLARCMDERHQREDALSRYTGTYVNFEGHVDWSSRAFVRAALIHNEAGQRDAALAILEDMMSRMGHLSHPIINKGRTLHIQWKNENKRKARR